MHSLSQLLVLLLLAAVVNSQTTVTVTASNQNINTLANYTFTVTFDSAFLRSNLTIHLPSQLATTNSTTVTQGGTLLTSIQYSITTNSIVLNKTVSNTTIIVSNVMNPSSGISTFDFTISSNISTDNQPASIYNYLTYVPGALQSCRYAFTGTTEQTNGTLTATLLLNDPVTIGSNIITIGYPISWQYLSSKSLTSGSPTLVCSYALNGGTSYTTIPCSYTQTSVSATLTLVAPISSNTFLQLKITGVNCPPTVSTPTSSSYIITVYDSNSAKINELSSCNISDTTVSQAAGAFTNTGLYINSIYSIPQINYTTTVPVSFQMSDTLEAYYSVTTPSCSSRLYIIRNTPLQWINTNTVSSVRYYSLSTATSNTASTSTLQLYMDCSFSTPPSATPTNFIFLFKRNTQLYLNLTASFTALAQPFASSSNFRLTLETASAASPSTYTFTLNISQPLSSQGQLTFTLPSHLTNATFGGLSSCTATISSLTATLSACDYISNGSKYLNVVFNHSNSISAASKIVVTVLGLKNPSYAYSSYSIGISIYYNQSVSSSLVEYNSSIYSVVYTTHTTYQLSISPSTYQVYTSSSLNISYTNEVYLNSGTTFKFVFPSAITTLTYGNTLFKGGSLKSINQSTLTTSAPFTLTITFYQSVAVGTILLFPITLRTPSNLGTYGPISFTATFNSYNYEQSSVLELAVTQTSDVSVAISVPASSTLGQYTGRQTSYTFFLTSYMPHSTPNYYLLITCPSDTSFTSSGSCSGSCLSTISLYNSSTINITIDNSYNWAGSSIYTYTITFGTFTNPRHIGSSMSWIFMSYNSDGSQVGTGTATFNTALPSPITGMLSKNYRYYRSNSQPVEIYLTLTNVLKSGDYILLQFGPDTYLNSSSAISCPQTLANCSISPKSTSNILVVTATPNINQLNSLSLTLQLSGLISASSTLYIDRNYFNVSTYTSADLMIDSGALTYNVSCGTYATYNCKECYTNGSCISCYTSQGMNLLGERCVSNCTNQSMYYSFNSSGTCLSCISPCLTCLNSTHCRTCIPNYFLTQNLTCIASCPTSNGYFTTTSASITYCLACYDSQCLVCVNSSTIGCTQCSTGVLQQGACAVSCTIPNTFLASDNTCQDCHSACNGCSGSGTGSCTKCSYNYYNSSGYCVSTCPDGTAAIVATQSCGCAGSCITCQTSSTYCLSCSPQSLTGATQFAYFGNCITSCPNFSYLSGSSCLPCSSGCFNCTATTCLTCTTGRYMYDNQCYQDCNSVGTQYDGTTSSGVLICVLCPTGCDSCSGYTCTSCLSGYSLQNGTCVEQCIVLGNCQSPVPDRILPMPGLLTVAVWAMIVVVIKLLMKKLYLPFGLMFIFALSQLGLIYGGAFILANAQTSTNATTASRLLFGIDYSYRTTIFTLLIVSLVVNYLSNLLHLLLFCKYMWPLLPSPKQIDYISNTLVLGLATLTNYRFALLVYSKMFPKPQIPIDNCSRLTPINYLCIGTLVLDGIPLAAAVMLIYKETAGTDLFMLGVDLLVVLAIMLVITIWMIAVPKADDFYSQEVRKTKAEEVYHQNFRTEEDLNNDKNISYSKLAPQNSLTFDKAAQETIQDELISHSNHNGGYFVAMNGKTHHRQTQQYQIQNQFVTHSEQQNPPLVNYQRQTTRKNKPTIPMTDKHDSQDIEEVIDFERNSFDSDELEGHSDGGSEPLGSKKTKRSQYSPSKDKVLHKKGKRKVEGNLDRRAKETAINFSKTKPIDNPREIFNYSGSQIIHIKEARVSQDRQIEEILGGGMDHVLTKSGNKNATQRSQLKKKHKPTRRDRQSEQKIFLKKQTVFQSNPSEVNSFKGQKMDLDQIIESKVKNSKKIQGKLPQSQRKHDPREDISPSWFNTQNQRFDISEIQ